MERGSYMSQREDDITSMTTVAIAGPPPVTNTGVSGVVVLTGTVHGLGASKNCTPVSASRGPVAPPGVRSGGGEAAKITGSGTAFKEIPIAVTVSTATVLVVPLSPSVNAPGTLSLISEAIAGLAAGVGTAH